MALELLKITGYQDENFQTPISGQPYEAMINPESIKLNRSITYNEQQPVDSSSTSQKYKSTPSESLSFDLVIDCTGIVDSKRLNLTDEINKLADIIYNYNGKIHRPNFVKVQWGTLSFQSVLKTFNTTYTLFKPDGSPLRAKISLSFGEYISPKKRKQEDGETSPDITHMVEVVEGDSLPSICTKVWNTPFDYVQVAQYNKLNKFRNLKGGTKLLFPPLIKQEE